MQPTSAALFVSLSLVVFGISYYYFTTRHKERMAIIEKGLPPDFFKGSANYLPVILTLGIVSIAIAAGVAAGALLGPWLPVEKAVTITSSAFLFMGLGLLLSWLILRQPRNKQ
ncbi:DUF6249 domain-containing protein [Chitinophaga cymbidii]|uniref:DUF6249 domain-containing protein n=1 Tax=Chitinophaga cymbidii TaxID=1096750 RepID=A0A512RG64_9BACT|nr:DUF6249 domain-containing protein [Chitinophaga cymbidii]GEP94701.1 hypothetical protein CCY01nite_09610 [Chitinophaga cymbidii]